LTEAPGTYHHSIIVANLAERAGEAIGADALLCRVAAYYHDVGKIVRPYAFIENQAAGDNIHDRLDPATSARMIAAHVPDGLALARRYKLPDKVREMIAQHHGTAFVGTFYQRAVKAAGGGTTIDQAGFRYQGPKPRTREAAILMLADGVEAMIRATGTHDPEAIEQVVRKIFSDRLGEGQLDDCGLTLGDLSAIRGIFVKILRAMFHPRITYPEYPAEATPATAPVLASSTTIDPN
jgi:putative nucleotidyltransferase with HDIG domain